MARKKVGGPEKDPVALEPRLQLHVAAPQRPRPVLSSSLEVSRLSWCSSAEGMFLPAPLFFWLFPALIPVCRQPLGTPAAADGFDSGS